MVVARAHATACWAKLGETKHDEGGEKIPKDPGTSSRLPRHAQRGTTGNVCLHPHEIRNIANKLPRPFNTMNDEIAVLIVSNDNQATANTFKRTPFLVRRQKILDALIWLKANNRFYHDIEIDLVALNEYPDSSNNDASPPFPVHFVQPDAVHHTEGGSYTGHGVNHVPVDVASSHDDATNTIKGTFDIDQTTDDYRLRTVDALRHLKNNHPFLKTSTSLNTINPREQPHVYAWLWPTLFPYGVGFFNDPVR
ncbi:hypothetical protein K435DRAFT_673260, partial [Dendrothele bispora CBS 962.96]